MTRRLMSAEEYQAHQRRLRRLEAVADDRAEQGEERPEPSKSLEHEQQVIVFQWATAAALKWPELMALYAIPNAGKRSFAAAKWMLAEGLRPGMPDICLPVPRNGFGACFIEMKIDGGKLSPAQHERLDVLRRAGNYAHVAYSAAEAIDHLERYLKGAQRTNPAA